MNGIMPLQKLAHLSDLHLDLSPEQRRRGVEPWWRPSSPSAWTMWW